MIHAIFIKESTEGILENLQYIMASQASLSERATLTIKGLAERVAEKLIAHELFDGLAVKEEDMDTFIENCEKKINAATDVFEKVQEALFLRSDIEAAQTILRESLATEIRYLLHGEYFLSHITHIDGKIYSELYDATWDEDAKEWKKKDGTPVTMPEPYILVPPNAVLEEYATKCLTRELAADGTGPEKTPAETVPAVHKEPEETPTETAPAVHEEMEETPAETAPAVHEEMEETPAETVPAVHKEPEETPAETTVIWPFN